MSFIDELKRRNVFRVGVAYVIVAWLLLQVADVILDNIEAPAWVFQAILLLLIIGFPMAIIFAWAFELSPDGIRREKVTPNTESRNRLSRRRLDFAIIGLLGLAVIYLVADNYLINDELPDVVPTSERTDRSIAVIPFRNRSARPEDAFFVDGIHDDILTRLATVSSFDKIISRTSVERYRDTTLPIPQIGRELGVSVIVEGGVQRSGDRVRINVQLIDAATDDHQWAKTYERELTAENVFAIQAEISEAIVNEMQASLSPQERENLGAIPTKSIEALEHYFRARDQLNRRRATSTQIALDELHAAVEIDPNFALAHATLAEAYGLAGGLMSWEEARIKVRKHATRALVLDPESGEAYSALASLEEHSDPVAAELAYRKAIELSPNNVYAHYNYCYLLGPILGKYASALERCERALEIDPLSQIVMTATGSVLWGLGRLEEAKLQYESTSETYPSFVVSRIMLGLMDWYAFAKLDESVKRLRQSFSLDPDNSNSVYLLGHLYLDLGDTQRAAFWFNVYADRYQKEIDNAENQALLCVRQGNTEGATEWARQIFDPQRKSASAWALSLLRDDALRRNRPEDARELYAKMHPDLLDDGVSELTAINFQAAIDLALVLYRSGEQQQADTLISLARRHMRTMSRTSAGGGFGIADVQIHAILGNSSNALSSLREAIDEGWRLQWWFYLKHDLALESLQNEPEFQEMFQEIEMEMTAQLERIREMEANGELAPIPE
jgi:TolB-like protein/Tfp pilus assembly protein PilF